MNAREQAAFRAGIETARQMALTAALTLEVRDDGGETRQRAAAAALQGLAEGLSVAFLAPPPEQSPLARVLCQIAEDPADRGTAACPDCGGPFDWIRAGPARHLHGQCRASGCLVLMQ